MNNNDLSSSREGEPFTRRRGSSVSAKICRMRRTLKHAMTKTMEIATLRELTFRYLFQNKNWGGERKDKAPLMDTPREETNLLSHVPLISRMYFTRSFDARSNSRLLTAYYWQLPEIAIFEERLRTLLAFITIHHHVYQSSESNLFTCLSIHFMAANVAW